MKSPVSKLFLPALVFVLLVTVGYLASDRLLSSRGTSLSKLTQDSDFVIAVAPFWGVDEAAVREGKVMRTLVERELLETLGDRDDVRVVGNEIEEPPRSMREAQMLGEELNASLIVWGQVLSVGDEMEIQPYMAVFGPNISRSGRLEATRTNVKKVMIDLAERDELQLRKMKAEELGEVAVLSAARYFRKRDPEMALELLNKSERSAENLRLRGDIYSDLKMWANAENNYNAALSKAPDEAWPFISLGWIYSKRGDKSGAEAMLKAAIERDPMSPKPHYHIGNLYAANYFYEEATAHYEEGIRKDPAYVWSYMGIGDVFEKQERYLDAIQLFQRASRIDPKHPAPHHALGSVYHWFLGRTPDAIREFKKALALDPENTLVMRGLAECYKTVDRIKEAKQLMHRAVNFEPKNTELRISLSEIYSRNGEYADAEAEILAAMEISTDAPELQTSLAQVYEKMKQYDKAVAAYHTAIELDSTDAFTHYALGQLYETMGRPDAAAAEYERTKTINPTDNFLPFMLALNNLNRERYEEAAELLEEIVSGSEEGAEWTDPNYFLGVALENLGRYEEATAAYAAAAASGFDWMHVQLGYFINLHRVGKPELAAAAMDHFADSLRVLSRIRDYGFRLDVVKFLDGTLSEKDLVVATGQDTQFEPLNRIIAYYYLGMAYLVGIPAELDSKRGDIKKARSYLRKCVAIRVSEETRPEEYDKAERELKRLNKG